jgi:hypothetical protein
MDKYAYFRLVETSTKVNVYQWFEYTINHLVPGYGKYFWTLHHPNDTNLGVWLTSLTELDNKLEELWQKHQSKSEVEA